MNTRTKETLRAIVIAAVVAAICLFGADWLIGLLQVIGWLSVGAGGVALVFCEDDLRKSFMRDLVEAWTRGDDEALAPVGFGHSALRLACIAAVVLSAARAGMPALAAGWLAMTLWGSWVYRQAFAEVRRMDRDVRRAQAAYEQAKNDAV